MRSRTYTSRADIEFEDIEIYGKLYSIQAEVSGEWEDQGIGALDVAGRPVYDSHYGISEFEVGDVLVQEQLDDGEMREIHDRDIVKKLIDYIYENKQDEVIKKMEEDRGSEDEDER